MAFAAIQITKSHTLDSGVASVLIKGGSAPAVATVVSDMAAVVTALGTVDTDTATLVADGASPTQGHVTTLNTDVGALDTANTALNTAVAALNKALDADVVVIWNTTNITSQNELHIALQAVMKAVVGGYGGLPT